MNNVTNPKPNNQPNIKNNNVGFFVQPKQTDNLGPNSKGLTAAEKELFSRNFS